jgi:hypothetical protein
MKRFDLAPTSLLGCTAYVLLTTPTRSPHSSHCPLPGAHTSCDFVPWRALDAGQLSARFLRYRRRPKTSTQAGISTAFPKEFDTRCSLAGLPRAWSVWDLVLWPRGKKRMMLGTVSDSYRAYTAAHRTRAPNRYTCHFCHIRQKRPRTCKCVNLLPHSER